MLNPERRQLAKRFLSWSRVKILYARITLTRYTTFYFFFALISCLLMSALQGLSHADNTQAVEVLEDILAKERVPYGIAMFEKGTLRLCSSIPGQPGSNCTSNLAIGPQFNLEKRRSPPTWRRSSAEESFIDDLVEIGFARSTSPMIAGPVPALPETEGLSDSCLVSLLWLSEVLHDAKREDVVTFVFHIWLFSLALLTVLNESIPHLGAALFGHVLGAAWSSFRLASTYKLTRSYRKVMVPIACQNVDFLGNWWDIRAQHAIGTLTVNIVTLVVFCGISIKLFKVYAKQSFSRVGASERVHRVYKLVLLFSVGLQLSGFFSLASTAMWIDKICHDVMKSMAKHAPLYLAAFIVILVIQIPWLILGWACVRKECKIGFGIFCALSLFLLALSTLLFFSNLYRYIFVTWPFFASVTVTAYVLLLFTSGLGVVCRMNFGKGLKHYLQVTEALEGVDFTPVYFTNRDIEEDENFSSEKQPEREPVPALPTQTHQPARAGRGPSVYSEKGGTPIMLSSSPPLVSELGAPPGRSRLSKASYRKSTVPSVRSLNLGPQNVDEEAPPLPPGLSSSAQRHLPPLVIPGGLKPKGDSGSPSKRGLHRSPSQFSVRTNSPIVPLPDVPAASSISIAGSSPKRSLPSNPRPGCF